MSTMRAVSIVLFLSLMGAGLGAHAQLNPVICAMLGNCPSSSTTTTQEPPANNPVATASGEGDPIIYGTQLYGQGAFIAKGPANATSQPVGVQANGWNYGAGESWGVAAEAIAFPGSTSTLVGVEALAVNANPMNFSRKIALNAVFRCAYGADPCAGPNNYDSIGLWISAGQGTGFDSGIKFDVNSLMDSPARRAAVIDLSDLPLFKDFVFVRLPGGHEITISQFAQAIARLN